MQKYPHITESYACILKMFAIMFLLLFWNMLKPKSIKVCHSFALACNAIQ